MHLQEIVLQGFKSYTSTVKITDFTKFTAITGLNGTGKSNIIDGIIFCLNLDTNKTLRIKKLEDLINTNCNEATVILKFNNCTISRSINREGKSKIHINNTLSTTKTLKKLLNQNNIQKNAQNVILQGNITKILNLTKNNYLVQETANIRVYMQEKEEALELIKKKEDKLIDTKETLKKRAEPYIGKLRSERGIYMEMKRCEEMKNKNMQIVEQNTGLLDENENNKKMLDLQQLMKDYEDKMIELEKLKSNDEKVTSVDYKQVYEMRNKIEEIKRNLNIVNVKIEQTNDNKTFDNKENVEIKKRKKGEKEREVVDLDELKGQIADLKEKERILINEIRNKEAENIGLGKENISDKLDNINKLKNERNMANSKLEEIKEGHPLFSIGDDEKLKTMHQKYTKDLADIEQNKISINDLNIVKSKYSKLLSGINYPIMSGVYGTVADNFVVKDNRHKEIIDIILGARRKYVIVDDEKIGAQILRNTRQRVNIIPLNKIRPNVDSRKEKIISQNMGENCMKLIDFEPKMKKALEYIFGNYYVFEDSSQAKKMCYKEKVPCISMDGNLYDPRGIVTGGVKKRYNDEQPLFKEILQTKQILNDLESKNYAYNNSQKECSNMQSFLSHYDAYRHLVSKIASLDDKIAMHQKFLSQNMDLKKELQNVKKTLNAKELVYNNEIEKEKIKYELEKQKKENEREREALIGTKKELEKDLADLNKQVQCVEIENERLSIYEKDKTICEDKVQFLSIAVAKLKKNINKLLDGIKTDEPQNEQNSSSEYPSYFSDLNTKIFVLMPKLQENIEILPSQEEEACKLELLKAKSDLEVLTKTKRRTMDPHNYEFLEKNEELLRFLEEKISKLENDKLKLISKISDLNKQSELELENAHKHLNAEAGKYLRLFLPDSDIRLDNIYNISVKITNWKNSVNELSGGQRSLVALSLIFAMLSYKPAPFYLFDEVDSALDISMTKNIGMCMKRFKEAQFIVVSLKEEFYKNASSIYQVYLSEGKTNVKKIK